MSTATGSPHELALMTAVFNLAQDALIVIDAAQCIQRFNAAAEHVFGYAGHDMLGQPVSRLMPERFQASHGEQVQRFAASQQGRRHMGRERLITGRHQGPATNFHWSRRSGRLLSAIRRIKLSACATSAPSKRPLPS